MIETRIENLLYDKFYHRKKIVVPEGCGVLTATDSYMFPGFQFLYFSLVLSHNIPICVIDLGMSECQRVWCEKQELIVQDLHVDRPMSDSRIIGYHAWNKPAYALQTPFRRTIWLDADVVVYGGLDIFFALIEKHPLFTMDSFGVSSELKNYEGLYSKLPIEPHSHSPIYLNSGVFAWDSDRDRGILDLWYSCVRTASEDVIVRRCIRWWDQGALIWALEKSGKTHLIRRERCFNSPAKIVGTPWKSEIESSVENFLLSIDNRDGSIVKHYMSHPKPWNNWPRDTVPISLENSLSSKLKIFLLGHNWERLSKIPDRPYLQKVNLSELPLGEHQSNQLAESRIYLSDHVKKNDHEYVGFASARWNEKYQYNSIFNIEEIHRISSLLKPKNVIVAVRTDNVLGPLGCLDVERWQTHLEFGNRGISRYLAELEEVSGITNRNVSFFANNFICHKDVFEDFINHWKMMFDYFYDKYRHRFYYIPNDPSRLAAYFYESITINYFSGRSDLNIIEAKKKQSFKPF